MRSDTFNCPKCQHSGDVSDLTCFNCNNQIYIEKKGSWSSITCTACGMKSTPSCPAECGANITINTISSNSRSFYQSIDDWFEEMEDLSIFSQFKLIIGIVVAAVLLAFCTMQSFQEVQMQCGAEVIVFNLLNNIRSIHCWQEPCDT